MTRSNVYCYLLNDIVKPASILMEVLSNTKVGDRAYAINGYTGSVSDYRGQQNQETYQGISYPYWQKLSKNFELMLLHLILRRSIDSRI